MPVPATGVGPVPADRTTPAIGLRPVATAPRMAGPMPVAGSISAPGAARPALPAPGARPRTGTAGRPGPVLAVVGPTATGKSALGLELAERLGGEVVNADSMQLYRGMDVGTAKLSQSERRGIPHHLLDIWDVSETASVAVYQRLARAAVDDVLARGRPPVLVGGSGLYLRAVLDDLDFPGTDPDLRVLVVHELASAGAPALHARLSTVDPLAARQILPGNGRRIVRALEVG